MNAMGIPVFRMAGLLALLVAWSCSSTPGKSSTPTLDALSDAADLDAGAELPGVPPDVAADLGSDSLPDTAAVDVAVDAIADTPDAAAPADVALDVAVLDVVPPDSSIADIAAPDSAAADISAPNVQCVGADYAFPAFAKACAVDDDCVVGMHQINCCGSHLALGLAKNDQAAFLAAESLCEAQYPGCGCAAMAPLAEDGYSALAGGSDIAAHCVAGACASYIPTAKLDCKDPNGGVPKPFKFCQKQADCALVMHTVDCCGTQASLGIAKSSQLGYEKAENVCGPALAVCDCKPKPVLAEDGVSAGDGMLAVQCQGGMCSSYVKM